jgi:hypothetical protein
MCMRTRTKQNERGFALLFVFALSGIAALMLYNELPRAVFESQRAKEDLLVSRGQEYQRGIQLYYRKFRKYPATMEELEKSSGIRFLRRRYVDPFSGKDDWRIVHVGPNGQFTDSKVIKPQQPAQSTGFGANSTTATEAPKEDPNDPAAKRLASDTSASEIGGANGAAPVNPNDPNALPQGAPPAPPGSQPGMQNGMPYPGRTGNEGSYQQQPVGYPGTVGVGGVGSVGVGLPNTTYPSAGINSQNGGAMGTPIQPAMPGYPQNQPGQRQLTPEQLNPAMDVIQRLLTQPRQPPPGVLQSGGAPSGPITSPSGTFLSSGPAANGGNGQFGGGGIAGVASKHEGKGIKLVNDRDRIEEWEFIYDYGKDRVGRPATNSQSQQANQGGINPAQGMGMGNMGGFGGQQGGFGGQQGGGGFGGQQGGGFGQQGGFGGGQQGGGFGQPRPTRPPN